MARQDTTGGGFGMSPAVSPQHPVRFTGHVRGLIRLLAVATTGALAAALLVAGAGAASATGPHERPWGTWNMQNGRTQGQWDWVERLARYAHVVALQEVPSQLPRRRYHGEERLRRLARIRSRGITIWRWESRYGVRYLTVLDQYPGRRFTTASRLALVTRWNPGRNHVVRIEHQPRALLGIENRNDGAGGTLYISFHAAANSGHRNDAAGLVWHVNDYALNTAHVRWWITLGDANRDPHDLARDGLPGGSYIYSTGQPTHLNRGQYDYGISNVLTLNWQTSRLGSHGSDHNPVVATPLISEEHEHAAWARISADNSRDGSPHNVAVSGQRARNGTHVIGWEPTTNDGQLWNFVPIGEDNHGHHLARIISRLRYTRPPHDELRRSLREDKCLDVNGGPHNKAGNFLNIWTCHGPDGQPLKNGKQRDTQNWIVVHPDKHFPDETALLNNSSLYNSSDPGFDGKYAYMSGDHNGDWLIQQWWKQRNATRGIPVSNELFHLHPVVPDA